LATLETVPSGNLRSDLAGFAYRFTVFLPLLSADGKAVFSDDPTTLLMQLFGERFGGFSANTIRGEPPWTGFWFPRGAQRPIVDRHIVYVIYSAQTPQAELFFQHLKAVLELPQVANQEVVLIEQLAVWLVQATPLPER
jgi:hypothetical protein